MSKVTAPLLSFAAAGQIAKTQVYAQWRGILYSRRYTVPANPRSTSQQQTRNVFGYLQQVWKLMASSSTAPWTAYATGRKFIDRNAFTSFNLPDMRTAVDNTTFVGSPGSGGGIPMDACAFSGGVGQVTATPTAPTVPTGWTIVEAGAIALKEQDPHTATDFRSVSGVNAVAPYAVPLVVAAGTYVVAAWMKYTKPDGSTAYSVGITGSATAT